MLYPLIVIFVTYFYQLFKEDELEQSTEVEIIFPVELKPVIIIEKSFSKTSQFWIAWDCFLYGMFTYE